MSTKVKKIPCSRCGVTLEYYWLKDGICGGCRNPHLIVTAVIKGDQMNKQIKDLNAQLANNLESIGDIETKLQAEWDRVFDDSGVIKAMMAKVEDSTDYRFDEYGEIVSYHYVDLSDFKDSKKYLVQYLRDSYCADLDLVNECITYSQGESIVIQDETRRDNGVWLSSKLIIDESEYKDENGVNETKRNELIEAYMEKTGCFPGVFRSDSHGNVFSVSTKV
jgi:hypothetical protein